MRVSTANLEATLLVSLFLSSDKKNKMVCQEKTEAPDFSVKCIPGYSVHYIADKRHKVFCGHLISDGFQIPLKLPF